MSSVALPVWVRGERVQRWLRCIWYPTLSNVLYYLAVWILARRRGELLQGLLEIISNVWKNPAGPSMTSLLIEMHLLHNRESNNYTEIYEPCNCHFASSHCELTSWGYLMVPLKKNNEIKINLNAVSGCQLIVSVRQTVSVHITLEPTVTMDVNVHQW